MRLTGKSFSVVLAVMLFVTGSSIFVFGAVPPAQAANLPYQGSYSTVDDDEKPDVTARVARISFIRGEVRIRRADGEDWEKATLNLPVVEGDEITTDAAARVEIQFDKDQHLRLAENSFLKIVNLKDEGIAVSLSLGTLNLRITSFDKDKSFFEIDAPKTTIAIQRAGSYRIDAGKAGDSEVRVAATKGGEARVYSDNAGFTVKDGRSARIFIDGANVGEWEATDASRFNDDFDTWALDRDSTIASRLKNAYYDKYYDNDIYGADDLNGNGDWVYTKSYGYVWRPFSTSIRGYADWSPYRYGHWRWMPPYGWIWVNDEPWGWATYHHGRWFYDNGYWNWSPYGYYRPTRSWWQPALVVINIINTNICWYPLPYHRRHHNYNWGYNRDRRRRNDNIDVRETAGIVGVIRTPRPDPADLSRRKPVDDVEDGPGGRVPLEGVVTVSSNNFGTRANSARRTPADIAKSILLKKVEDNDRPILPVYSEQKRRIRPDIITERPAADAVVLRTRVGAGIRKTDAPMDDELRTKRVFGGRQPKTQGDTGPIKAVNGGSFEPRRTGGVDRLPANQRNEIEKPLNQTPLYVPRETLRTESPKPTRKDSPRIEPPTEREKPRNEAPTPIRKESPRFEPPTEREKPRNEAPTPIRKESPRFEPPTERPRIETPKPKETPRVEQPKSEPKQENKPTRPPDAPRKETPKDGLEK